MAGRKRVNVALGGPAGGTPGEPPGQPPGGYSPADGADDEFDIDHAVASLGAGGATATISRKDDRGMMARVCSVQASQISQDFLQANFGGGSYEIRFRRGDGTLDKLRKVEIDRRIPARLPEWVLGTADVPPARTAAASSPATAVPAAAASGTTMDMLLMTQMMDMMREANEMRARTSETQMMMMKTMMESSATMVATITKGNQGNERGITAADLMKMNADSRKEMMEMIMLMDKLKAPNPESASIERALSLIGKFRDLSGEFGGDGESRGGGMFDGMLAKMAELVFPMVAGMIPGASASAAAAPALPPAGAVPQALPAAPPAADPAVAQPPAAPPVDFAIQMVLQSLFESAVRGDDPKDKAISLLEMCPDVYRGRLREFIMATDAIDQLVAKVPEFGQYRVWLTECIDELRKDFTAPDEAPENK